MTPHSVRVMLALLRCPLPPFPVDGKTQQAQTPLSWSSFLKSEVSAYSPGILCQGLQQPSQGAVMKGAEKMLQWGVGVANQHHVRKLIFCQSLTRMPPLGFVFDPTVAMQMAATRSCRQQETCSALIHRSPAASCRC